MGYRDFRTEFPEDDADAPSMSRAGARHRHPDTWDHRYEEAAAPAPEPGLTAIIGAILRRREQPSGSFANARPDRPAPREEAARRDGDVYRRPADRERPVPRRGDWTLRALGCGVALTIAAAGAVWSLLPTERFSADAHIVLAMPAIADETERLSLLRAQARAVVGVDTLSKSIERARLDQDPEFSAEATSGWGLVTELLSGSSYTDLRQAAQAKLRAAVATSVDPASDTIVLTVNSQDAAKSTMIANEIASVFVETNNAAGAVRQIDLPAATETDAAGALATAAQAELDAFTASGGDKLKQAVQLRRELDGLRLENAAAQKRLLQESGKTVSGSMASLLDGTFPAAFLTPALEDLRARYVSSRVALDQLAVAFGPRHPRLLTAQSVTAALKTDIEREIRGVFADARASLQQAQDKARQLADKSAAAAAKLRDTGIDYDRFETLQAAADAARQNVPDTISTGSIPANAFATAVAMPAVAAAVASTETSVPGILAALVFALGTGACVLGLAQVWRRKLARPSPAVREMWPPIDEDWQAFEEPAAYAASRRHPAPSTYHRDPKAYGGEHYPDESHDEHAADDAAPWRRMSLMEELRRAAPQPFGQDAENGDIRQLKQDVAALRERVEDFAERRSRRRA